MILDELISIRAFPSVVQAAEIHELRDAPTSPQTLDFVRGYLGFDDRSRHALEAIVRSLSSQSNSQHNAQHNSQNAKTQNGGAWFLNGVFGSGKSHLLGVIALLGDGIAHDALRESHPHLSPLLDNVAPRFVTHFSLDEYSAARVSLEEIFWREVACEWTRRGFDANEIEYSMGDLSREVSANAAQKNALIDHDSPDNSNNETSSNETSHNSFTKSASVNSRGETFAAFDAVLRARGFASWMVCIDELSLFLSGREHRALQQDASWLQFLGQRARRAVDESSTRCAFHIVAALQKTVEDIGDIDAYALSQIRDRFTILPLSLAHLPSLIERRLIVRKNADQIAQLCEETFARISGALPHLDFGRDEWKRLFPFHPATISLLEKLSSRFGSRTRSAVVFCQGIDVQRDARHRVLADELFDFFEPELHTYPDLKPLVALWQNWPQAERDLARDGEEAQRLRQIMKALLVYKIAGVAPTIAQIANSLLLDARLPDDGNYEYTRVLLEKIRVQSGGLAIEKRDGAFADRYTLDSGARVGEMARRGVSNLLQTLPTGDSRIQSYALGCCRGAEMPLASLQVAASVETLWHHTPRRFRVLSEAVPPSPQNLANVLAALSARGGEDDACLFLVPPFADDENMAELWRENLESGYALWRENIDIEYSKIDDISRWRGALAWWIPRAATASEWDEAREATAQHLLLQDPQLGDNRRGRAVVEHLRERLAERENAVARLCTRLMREGTLGNGAGSHLEAGDLALGESWSVSLEAIASWCLPTVFPRFERVAPRLRVLAPATIDALCLETLRRLHDTPFFAASQERNVRALAAPLGIARESGGRWKISVPHDEIAHFMTTQVEQNGGAMPLSHLEAKARKSVWGLNEGQTRLVTCALIRSGALSACDARGQSLTGREIGLPLSRSVHHLRVGSLLDSETWTRLQRLIGILTTETLGDVSFEEQERARQNVETWRDETTSTTELAQVRLHQLKKRLGADGASWNAASETLARVGAALNGLPRDGSIIDYLQTVASWPHDDWRDLFEAHQVLVITLENSQAAWLELFAFLTHDELVIAPEMRESRAQLLTRFDDVLRDENLLRDAQNWRDEYSKSYREWHATQHAPERWLGLRRVEMGEEFAVLARLQQIATRRFGDADLPKQLNAERDKMCRFDGSLRGEPVCAACKLKLGERVLLRDPSDFMTQIGAAILTFREVLREETVQHFLVRHERSANLISWRDDGENAALLCELDSETLQLLEDAFRPRRRVSRSWNQLITSAQSTNGHIYTPAELRAVLLNWLDGGDNLNNDDEVKIEEDS